MNVILKKAYTKSEIKKMDEIIQKKSTEIACKAQWLMIIAYNQVCGIGKSRVDKVFKVYADLVEEYKIFDKDDIAEYMLLRKVNELKFDVPYLYPQGLTKASDPSII